MTTLDPTIQHSAGVEAIIEKMNGKSLPPPPGMKPAETAAPNAAPAPAVQETQQPKESVADFIMGAMAPEAPQEQPEVQEPEVVQETPQAPAPRNPRLARSAEIQRRAAEAQRRARTEANRLRARPGPKQQESDPLADQRAALQSEKDQIARIRANLDAEVRLAQTNPLGFASRHGVDGKAMADFVRNGADPNKLAIERVRQDAARAIAEVEERSNQRIAAIQDAFAASEEARVQHNFFTFVEDAKASNPEAFAALSSGLVYSDKDVWDTANRLMEENADLRDNFDEDRLLEAVEAEARRDTRWAKVQQLTKQASSNKQSKQQATRVESNVRAKEEVTEQALAREPAPSRQSPPGTRDPSTGQFVAKTTTPFDRHQVHVDNLLRSGRIGIR